MGLDPEAAGRVLDIVCADDLALRGAVVQLLADEGKPTLRGAPRPAPVDSARPEASAPSVERRSSTGDPPVDSAGFPVLRLPARYEDTGHIGCGGMGEVRSIRDLALGRVVAAKLLDRTLAVRPDLVQGFVDEAQITAQLAHPNIVPVHDLSRDLAGTPYFTMKRVEGRTLHDMLHDAAFPVGSSERLSAAFEVFFKVCDAVAFAHSRGVLHRDIKPANIMVGAFGEVYLMDWGLAKVLRPGPDGVVIRRTHAGESGSVGTPSFMAPEMVNLELDRVDGRADVFGLGAVLYQIVTGRPPFESATVEEVMAKTLLCDLDFGGSGDSFVPKNLVRVLEKAMAREPEDRYATATELATDLRAFVHRGMHLPRETFQAGQTIIREGVRGDKAYIVTRGRCEVFKAVNGERRAIRVMGPGSLFGEMAILGATLRTASVVAATDVTVLVLSRGVIEESFGTDSWEGLLVKSLVDRFRELDQRATLTEP